MSAVIPPWAAMVLDREFPAALEGMERKGRLLVESGQPEPGQQLLYAVAQIRRAGRERWEAYELQRSGSGGGTAEVPPPMDGARSDLLLDSRVTSGEAATKLGLSDEYVRRMCRDLQLVAVQVGGRWLIDELSLAAEYQRRQEQAS